MTATYPIVTAAGQLSDEIENLTIENHVADGGAGPLGGGGLGGDKGFAMTLSALQLPSLAAALAGVVVGGAATGSARADSQYHSHSYPTVVTAAPEAVAPASSVTIVSSTCYLTHRWIDGIRHRVRVCDYTVAP
jgi:hypothetical protein